MRAGLRGRAYIPTAAPGIYIALQFAASSMTMLVGVVFVKRGPGRQFRTKGNSGK